MADLPDLDTSSTGYVAYWNAIDNGASEIDPTEVTSEPAVMSYTLYDNGLEGTYDLSYHISDLPTDHTPTATFRVKTDGWFAVYLDRTENFKVAHNNGGSGNNPDYSQETDGWWRIDPRWAQCGYYDGAGGWHRVGPAPTITQNGLFRAINRLHQELSNSAVITFNYSDVGLWDYQHSPTATTLFTDQNILDGTHSCEFSYSDGTTIERGVALGSGSCRTGYSRRATVSFEGIDVMDCYDEAPELGSYNITDVITNSGTLYQNPNDSDGNDQSGLRATTMVKWS